jgi:hypothetical protein
MGGHAKLGIIAKTVGAAESTDLLLVCKNSRYLSYVPTKYGKIEPCMCARPVNIAF